MKSPRVAFVLVLLVSGAVAGSCLCSEEAHGDRYRSDHVLTLYNADGGINRISTARSRVSLSVSLLPTSAVSDPTEFFFPDDPPEPSVSSTLSVLNGSTPVLQSMPGDPLASGEGSVVANCVSSLSNGSADVPRPSRGSRSTTSFYMSRPFDDLVYAASPVCRHTILHDDDVVSVRADWRVKQIITVAGKFVYVWHLKHREQLGVRCFHGGAPPSDAWFMRREGKQHIISSVAGALLCWDAQSGFCKERKEAQDVHADLRAHLSSPSVGTKRHTLTINGKSVFIMDQAQQVMKIRHDQRVQCARFSPNGAYVVTGAGNNAYVWQVAVARRRRDRERQINDDRMLASLYGARAAKNILHKNEKR